MFLQHLEPSPCILQGQALALRDFFMHELPITENILDIVCRHAGRNNVHRVVSITLDIGELSDLEEEWMQHYFDYLSKDTVAEKARLRIHRLPIVLKCNGCGHSFTIEKSTLGSSACPECGAGGDFSLVSGRQYQIREMEAE